jgi:hypothetical protein
MRQGGRPPAGWGEQGTQRARPLGSPGMGNFTSVTVFDSEASFLPDHAGSLLVLATNLA